MNCKCNLVIKKECISKYNVNNIICKSYLLQNMKQVVPGILITLFLPLALIAQDSIPVPGSYDEGFFLVGNNDVLKFKGYAQFDAQFPMGKSPGISEFSVRRARFAVTGFFQRKFRYMLNISYDRGKTALQEAFLESRHISFAHLRVGQFKVPFSLTTLQSDAQLDFIGRSIIVDNFSPSYDVGAMVFSDKKYKHFDYAFGVFNGRGLNQSENNNSKFLIGRIEAAPFISSGQATLSKLYLGFSAAYGKNSNPVGKTSYKTVTEVPVFTFNDSINQIGKNSVYGYDLVWYYKSFSASAEYLQFHGQYLRNSTDNIDFTSNGYYLAGTFILTGEEKKRNQFVKPKKEFDPVNRTWGAFEVAARFEVVRLSSSYVLANFSKGTDALKSISVGLNWYLNDDVKVILNYYHYMFNQNIVLESKSYQSSYNVIFRVQYQF
jgi:phosphate-selective porin OprO/OprP